jgi:uridine kinase
MTCFVAISAAIGGGKTTLVRGLAAALNGAPTLHFDHYEVATRKSSAELALWIAEGADFNQLRAPGLLDALQALKRGEPVTDPVTGERIVPGDYVILEMPLGREYAETAHLIDIVIWIDTPLDVALARKAGALTAEAAADMSSDPREFLEWLECYLAQYTDQIRSILQLQKTRVAASADVILDGLRSRETLVHDALSAIGRR